MVPSLPLLYCASSVSVKENPDRKEKNVSILCAIQLILERVHLVAKYSIINLKSNFALI